MNTKLSKKAVWSIYQVIGLVMILSMLFGTPLAVMGWTEPVPPDAEPGSIVTIKVGDSYEGQYDKTLPVEVTVTSGPVSSAYPEGYKPLCVPVGWGVDGIWTCEIQLDPDEAISVGEYTYMVKQGDIIEYGTFTDAAPPKVGGLNHCDPPTPYDQATYDCSGTSNTGWTSGANDGIYYEGNAIPYRVYFQNLVVGHAYYYELEWDTTKSSKHALDYITSYNYTVLNADPCIGLPCSGAPQTTIAIPPDTFMQSDPNWMGTQAPGVFSMWGGTLTSTGPYTTPLSYIGDTSTSIKVYFTATSEDAVIAWGGHISERADWGPENSAVFISGKPFHMRSVSFYDITMDTSRSAGSTDLALDSTGVIYPAYVKIIKNAIPDSEQLFSFTGSFAPFSLKDNGTDPNYISFSTTEFGSKTITETEPTGWDLTDINCVQMATGSTGSVTSVTPPSAILNVQEGDMWECTFTNEVLYGNIIVDKVTVPAGDSQLFTFTKSWGGGGTFQLADGTTPHDSGPILAGMYSVSETVPAGWDLTNVTCLSDDGVTTYLPTAINLSPMETVTCTFTNTKRGQIIVDKVTVPAGDAQLFTFNPSWSETDFQLADATTPHNSGYLVPGTYSIAETVPTGWDLTSTVCVSSLGHTETAGSLNLNPGETITCTFTNTKRGKIIVDKVTIPAADPQLFTFTPSWGAPFQLADATLPHDSGWLVPGSYSVSETVPAGWDLTSTVCISSLGHTETAAALNLNPGETITCTFTNTKRGKIIIDKNTVPAGDLQLFTFTPSWGTPPVSFQLAHATTPYDSGWLVPGSYTVIESAQAGWDLTGIVCNGVPQNLAARTATINLAAGQTVTCVFTNSKLPELKLVKNVVGGTAMPDDWKLYATAAAPNNGKNFWNLGGSGVFNIVYASVGYVLTETLENPAYLDMYMASAWSCDKAGVLSGSTVTLAYGDKVTCTITNTLLVPGWTPGFWKNHAAGAPHGKDAWQYTAFMPGDLLDDIFELGMVAGLPVKGSSTGFIDKTLMEALSFRGGGGEAGAAEILLRAAVASLLNASFVENYGHPTIPNLVFPMTVDEVIEAVNEALDSYDRYEMLTLAAELDYINNGSWEFPWHLLP